MLALLASASVVLTTLADTNRNNMSNTYSCIHSRETPDDGQWTCPKYVEVFTKINFRNSLSRWLSL